MEGGEREKKGKMNILSQSIFISKHQNTSMSHIMSKVNDFLFTEGICNKECTLRRPRSKVRVGSKRGDFGLSFLHFLRRYLGSFKYKSRPKAANSFRRLFADHFSLNSNCAIMVYYGVSLAALLPDRLVPHSDL